MTSIIYVWVNDFSSLQFSTPRNSGQLDGSVLWKKFGFIKTWFENQTRMY